ncbi:MAG: hypothetical protein R3D05_12470 [Dongiaceae bacterium]
MSSGQTQTLYESETIVYDGAKHRCYAWGFVLLLTILVAVAGICVYEVVGQVARNELPVTALIAPAPIAFLAWIAYSVLRQYDAAPLTVTILQTGFVRFRVRDVEETYAAERFSLITYAYSGSYGALTLRVRDRAWRLPCSNRDAERIIAAMATLNPDIKVEREERWVSGDR